MVPESDYPYEGVDEKCSMDKSEIAVQINGSVKISSNEDGKNIISLNLYFWFENNFMRVI